MMKNCILFISFTVLFKTATQVLDRVPYLNFIGVLNSITFGISTHQRFHRTILVLVAVSDIKVIKSSLVSKIKTEISKIEITIETVVQL